MLCFSAGVGRTGTFVAVDYLLRKIEMDSSIDVFHLVLEMRSHRTNMVQTLVGDMTFHTVYRNHYLKISKVGLKANYGTPVYSTVAIMRVPLNS